MSFADPAPALHTPKLTIATSGKGRHDENDLKIAQRVVDMEARLEALEQRVVYESERSRHRDFDLSADFSRLEDRVKRIVAAGPMYQARYVEAPVTYKCPCNTTNGCDNHGCDKPLYGTRAADDDASEWDGEALAAEFQGESDANFLRYLARRYQLPGFVKRSLSRIADDMETRP